MEAAKAAAEEHVQEGLNYSGQSSPDFFHDHRFLQHSATFPMMNGPPPAVAPCNPQYANPSNASMESLDRTLLVARAGQNGLRQEIYGNILEHHNPLNFGIPLHNSLSDDLTQFSVQEESVSPYTATRNFSYPSLSNVYHQPSIESIPEVQNSPEQVRDNTPTTFVNVPQIMTTFPSQLLSQSYDGLSSHCDDESQSQSPEASRTESTYGVGFNYQIQESEEPSEIPPPPSSLPFRSPPSMDIASRRKKVHVKPTTLMTDTRGRPQLGPRTVSHADGFRRSSDSPMPSPMRRIVSAGGNRNVMSGRIQKSGVESAQRSPMNYGSFPDAGSFIEHNYQNIRNPPTLTAGSSLTSSLAPPTPMSPRDRGMTLKRETSASSSGSPVEMNYVYSAGGFTHMDGEHMASPPETPQNPLVLNTLPSSNGWPSQEFHETWYDVPDEPLYTPALDVFPMELQMPPAYLCNLSQPVTPAFGQFQPNLMFSTSPQFENDQPLYTHSNHSHAEYTFPDSQSNFSSGIFPSPINQNKTFQFSNSTPADFTEK